MQRRLPISIALKPNLEPPGFSPTSRLMSLAFILVNLWVYLLWVFVSRSQRGDRVVYASLFRLRIMLEFLSQAVERHFPVITAVYLPALE